LAQAEWVRRKGCLDRVYLPLDLACRGDLSGYRLAQKR
jgi:hypothetical protein